MRTSLVAILSFCLILFSLMSSAKAQSLQTNEVQNGVAQNAAGERLMDFYAIHRRTKVLLTDVSLTVKVSAENYKRQESWEVKTDSQGLCRIRLPDYPIETLRLYPKKRGFVPLFIMWRGVPTPPELPKVFTVAMEPSTTIGGIIQNERGEPIEGVAVGVYYRMADPDAADNVRVDILVDHAIEMDIKTDKAGRWTFGEMPAEIDKNELRIFLKHPHYLSDGLRPGFIPMPITRQPLIENLRDFSAVMVMKEGLEVTGKVTDGKGKPIAGAKIYDTEDYWWRTIKPFAETDVQGQFRVNVNPGMVTWTVQATGYAPDLKDITIKEGMPPVEIRLEPGCVIEGNVSDQAGKPIEGAGVSAEDWRRSSRRLHLEDRTDAEGNFRIIDAPSDEVTFDIGKEGYMLLEDYPMKTGERKYNITLRPTLKVRGTVFDAQTGRPIDKFTVTNGFDYEDGRAPQWDTFTVRTFTGGQYEMEYMQEIFTYRLRIDAEDYQSAISDCIRPSEISESQIVLDFKLDKAAALMGKVLSPDGVPLSDAEVVIATDRLRIINGNPDFHQDHSSKQNLILLTDANGEFRFEPPVSLYTIVVLSGRGYAKISQTEFAASKVITVSPWGRIEGTLRIGAQPGVNKLVVFMPEFRREQEQPQIDFEYEAQTDKNGYFSFPRVLPDKGTVVRATPIDDGARRYSYHLGVEVKSVETTRVQIGGTGRPVIGRIVIPDMIQNIFDWQYTDCSVRISSLIDPPYRILALECDKDGSFRIEDVPAGDYCLYVHAYGPPPNTRTFRGERIGELSRVFRVPEMPGGRSDEPFDLGQMELGVIGKSNFIPSLIGKLLPDLIDMKMSPELVQTDDKIILVCFWDMNQRPSRWCILELARQAEQLKQKGITIAAVQASKVDQKSLHEWVKQNNISFPVGMIQIDAEKTLFAWGVRSLPWLILTDNKRVVVSEGFQLGDLDNQLRQDGRNKSENRT